MARSVATTRAHAEAARNTKGATVHRYPFRSISIDDKKTHTIKGPPKVEDLFENHLSQTLRREAPLAARMRPARFEDFVGQQHIIGDGTVLRHAIDSDNLPSVIFWGPPGTGKTTLANLIANVTKARFSPLSAVTAGVADLRKVILEARNHRSLHSQRTILFVDEIHRFNKSQQDVILPHVEDGTITLIKTIVERAIKTESTYEESRDIKIDTPALNHLILLSSGDARIALNTLEIVISATKIRSDKPPVVSLEMVEDALQSRSPAYDKGGEEHYNTISAFIKSVRDSDPDAAIYWLGRMITAGEDPMFIARRLVILASEDIGIADPQGLQIAVAAQQALHFIGMPEGRIPLAEATIYLATAPKSNSAYSAINKALEDVKNTRNDPVPLHLRNPVTNLMKQIGYGQGYQYAHNYPDHYIRMDNLPDSVKNRVYYEPTQHGYENIIYKRLESWRKDKSTTQNDIDQTYDHSS